MTDNLRHAQYTSVGTQIDDPQKLYGDVAQNPSSKLLVGEDGSALSPLGPRFTLANLLANYPASASNAGESVIIADVGIPGIGVVVVSDGTSWRPFNGSQLLHRSQGSILAPLASISAVGKLVLPGGAMVTAGSIVLPANLLAVVGSGIEVSAKIRHTGTAGAWNAAAKVGTLDNSTDNTFAFFIGTAVTDQDVPLKNDMYTLTSTTFISGGYAPPNTASPGSFTLKNTQYNTAAQMYLGLYSSTLTGPDTVNLLQLEVYWKG